MSIKIRRKDLLPDLDKRLRYWYDKKWKGTQEQFSDAVLARSNATEEDNSKTLPVSRWLHGSLAPIKYLPAICTVLGVDLSEFTIATDKDDYHYSTEYADDLEKRLEEVAEHNFKIDLTFLQGIRNILPDFDSKFPVFSPLRFYEDDEFRKPYERQPLAETSEPHKGKGLFRILKDGKYVFLTKYDMKMIKHLQSYIQRCVYCWFEMVSKDLEIAEVNTNKKFMELNPPRPPIEDILTELSDEELQKIDAWGLYTESELKKYRLPKNGFDYETAKKEKENDKH